MNGYDLIVIGAGAAGMMAAGTAAGEGARVLLLEKNARPGRKLMITGKGRCNVTNHCAPQEVIANVVTNGRFLYSAVSQFPPEETMRFFEALGVALKTERGNRVFPVSDRASEIVDALVRFVRRSGAVLQQEAAHTLWLEGGELRGVTGASGERYPAGKVLVACGGMSYPGTGSDGTGYRLAKQAGHTIVPLRPSLVPVVSADGDCAAMQGLSLRNCAVQVYDRKTGKPVYTDFGELLFTHFGLSGPVVLSAGSHIREMAPGRYVFRIDLKPALSFEKLDARLVRDFEAGPNRDFLHVLEGLLPRKMVPVAARRAEIDLHVKCHSVTREQRRGLVTLLKDFTVPVEGFRPIAEAIVTAGGVSVKEVSPKTMESKLCPGLYFAGEVLDVDAYTGGFNLQIAFSTGRLAGKCAALDKWQESGKK